MSRVLFRPHRGGLDQAMKECRVFSSIVNLLGYVCNEYNNYFSKSAKIKDFTLHYYCFDERIVWDTFVICDPDGHVFGWCAFNEDAKTEWVV